MALMQDAHTDVVTDTTGRKHYTIMLNMDRYEAVVDVSSICCFVPDKEMWTTVLLFPRGRTVPLSKTGWYLCDEEVTKITAPCMLGYLDDRPEAVCVGFRVCHEEVYALVQPFDTGNKLTDDSMVHVIMKNICVLGRPVENDQDGGPLFKSKISEYLGSSDVFGAMGLDSIEKLQSWNNPKPKVRPIDRHEKMYDAAVVAVRKNAKEFATKRGNRVDSALEKSRIEALMPGVQSLYESLNDTMGDWALPDCQNRPGWYRTYEDNTIVIHFDSQNLVVEDVVRKLLTFERFEGENDYLEKVLSDGVLIKTIASGTAPRLSPLPVMKPDEEMATLLERAKEKLAEQEVLKKAEEHGEAAQKVFEDNDSDDDSGDDYPPQIDANDPDKVDAENKAGSSVCRSLNEDLGKVEQPEQAAASSDASDAPELSEKAKGKLPVEPRDKLERAAKLPKPSAPKVDSEDVKVKMEPDVVPNSMAGKRKPGGQPGPRGPYAKKPKATFLEIDSDSAPDSKKMKEMTAKTDKLQTALDKAKDEAKEMAATIANLREALYTLKTEKAVLEKDVESATGAHGDAVKLAKAEVEAEMAKSLRAEYEKGMAAAFEMMKKCADLGVRPAAPY